MPTDDADDALLRDYCAGASETAFRALVDRHLPTVWSAARRVVNGDAALAEDIAQEVFAHLAQGAGKLPPRVVLGGWLHRHTCFTAAKTVRAAARRRAREQTAAAMQTSPDDPWPDIAPHLNAALNALSTSDRDAVVLRFFEKRDFRAIGQALGTSEDAARMKTGRALEKLRGLLGKRTGLLTTVAGLTVMLGDNAVAVPPTGMAADITASSLTNAARSTALTGFAAFLGRLRKLKVALAGVGVLLMAGGSIWYWQTQFGDAGKKPRTALTAPGKPGARAEAKEPGVVDVALHFLTVPDDKAAAILNQRWNADDDTALLTDLLKQAGTDAGGVVMAQRLTGSCRSGSRIVLSRTKPFSYATEWDLLEDGTFKAHNSINSGIGTTADIELFVSEDGPTCELVLRLIHHFAEPEIVRWPVSLTRPDAPELPAIQQPEIREAGTSALVFMEMGKARMVFASQLPPPNGPAPGASPGYLFTFVSLPPLVTGPATTGNLADTAKEVSLRVVTFEKAGTATALEAARPGDEEKLFASLAASAAGGSAKITGDQTVAIRSGQRSKVEAIREFPYPTEFDTRLSMALQLPRRFTFRNTGQTTEAEATVGEAGSLSFPGFPLDINLAPETVAMAFLNPWPAPDLRGSGAMGQVTQPVFTTYKSTNQILAATGRHILISVAAAPQTVMAENPQPMYRYRFLRTGLNGEKPAAARDHLHVQRRLHALTIRLPRDEAALLLAQRKGSDAALFDELSARVTAGTASLSSHTAILCRNGRRSKVESISEFPSPDKLEDLVPTRWPFSNLGATLEVEAGGQFSGNRQPVPGDWNLALEMAASPEMIEYYPDAKRPALHGAAFEYVRRQFNQQVTIPPSGVLCAGVLSTSSASEEEGEPNGNTDLCFVLQSPPPEKTEAESRPQIFLQALLLSVPVTDGPALAGITKPSASSAKAAALLQRLSSGDLHCAAHAAVIVSRGMKSWPDMHTRSLAHCQRLVPQPGEIKPSEASPELKVPNSWDSVFCGLSFEVEYKGAADGITVNAALAWDSAPVLPFGEPGAEIPNMAARRSEERIELNDLTLPPDKPVIADVRPSKAREGTPEHGRWHVLILKATPSPWKANDQEGTK